MFSYLQHPFETQVAFVFVVFCCSVCIFLIHFSNTFFDPTWGVQEEGLSSNPFFQKCQKLVFLVSHQGLSQVVFSETLSNRVLNKKLVKFY